ncbi:alpha/beta hydrolase family protein [Pseudalkalibacillus sp. R45]|uniref:alpha/beta hydrolase family protein n=1 Tax=Pseudalkalibacillus sp. R45 TaxID=3457433 RepID=UPI003FCD153D
METVIKSVTEVIQLSDRLTDIFHDNSYDLVLLGSSMGGLIASGAFVQNDRLNGLIMLNGSGYWTGCEDYFQKIGFKPSGWVEEIQKFDPIKGVVAIQERPILLHGPNDQIIPANTQQLFFEKAVEQYDDKEKIKIELFPNVNHTTTLAMVEQSVT